MDSARILVELGLVLLGIAVLARIAERLTVPAIPFYLLAGLAFGEGGVLPLVTTADFIEVGASLGVILLLFSLGLEYSARELVRTLRVQARAGVLDLVLNFTPGFVAGILMGWEPITAAALGGVTYVSSSGIIAKLLVDLGWLGNRETQSVVSLLVLEDLAMAFYLPMLAGLLIGGGLSVRGLLTSAAAIVVVIVLLLGALRVEIGISRFLFSRSDEVLLFTILGVTILVAGIAELVQISAAVGALLVGLVVAGPAAEGARPLLRPLRDFFAALFFAFFGLTVDPSQIPPALGLASALAVVTVIAKFATGWWSAGWAGVGRRGRIRAGLLLIAHGEFSIVVAVIAIASGLEGIGPFAVSYVLVLAVIGPLSVRFAEPLMALADRRAANRPDVASG